MLKTIVLLAFLASAAIASPFNSYGDNGWNGWNGWNADWNGRGIVADVGISRGYLNNGPWSSGPRGAWLSSYNSLNGWNSPYGASRWNGWYGAGWPYRAAEVAADAVYDTTYANVFPSRYGRVGYDYNNPFARYY